MKITIKNVQLFYLRNSKKSSYFIQVKFYLKKLTQSAVSANTS